MAKATANSAAQLKKDLKNGAIQTLYLIFGDEDYLKEYYRDQLIKLVVDETFREFNLHCFDGKSLTPELLIDAIDSYPAMAERKLVLVNDFDLYKAPAAFQDVLPRILNDLPPYVCLVFYFNTQEFKADKRLKIHAILEKQACFAEFTHLDDRELVDWVRRRVRLLGKDIDDDTCQHIIFLCGNAMTNLITEIEKACALSTLDHITKYHIDQVCTRALDAVIFDLTDAIAGQKFEQAIAIFQDLVAQKNDEIMLFSAIMRHMQRLYAARLVEQSRGGERLLMDLAGSRSPYYIRKLSDSARKLSNTWLRKAVLSCADTDAALKSSAADRKKLIELTLLCMAANFGEIS